MGQAHSPVPFALVYRGCNGNCCESGCRGCTPAVETAWALSGSSIIPPSPAPHVRRGHGDYACICAVTASALAALLPNDTLGKMYQFVLSSLLQSYSARPSDIDSYQFCMRPDNWHTLCPQPSSLTARMVRPFR